MVKLHIHRNKADEYIVDKSIDILSDDDDDAYSENDEEF